MNTQETRIALGQIVVGASRVDWKQGGADIMAAADVYALAVHVEACGDVNLTFNHGVWSGPMCGDDWYCETAKEYLNE